MKVRFVDKQPQAKDIYSFYFKPEKPVNYIAGQFIELYLPHENKDKRGYKRWFTLSSSPHEKYLAITTNFTHPKGSSFKQTLKNLKPCQQVNMAAPMGDFVLPKDTSIPLLFIAGGIGCTPFHSIISWLQATGQKRQISLLYSARDLEKVAFRSMFDVLGKDFKIMLQNPHVGWKGLTGKLSAKMIMKNFAITPKHYVYISGPEPMVEIIFKDLKDLDINKKHIYTDFFPGYTF